MITAIATQEGARCAPSCTHPDRRCGHVPVSALPRRAGCLTAPPLGIPARAGAKRLRQPGLQRSGFSSQGPPAGTNRAPDSTRAAVAAASRSCVRAEAVIAGGGAAATDRRCARMARNTQDVLPRRRFLRFGLRMSNPGRRHRGRCARTRSQAPGPRLDRRVSFAPARAFRTTGPAREFRTST